MSMRFDIVIVIFVTLTVGFCIGVEINEMRVPGWVRNGSEEFVTLDCDYSVEDHGLVVKWFFNKHPLPVYQWIHNQKPQVLGIFKDKLNLDYRASDDEYKMYRAMQIIRPTTEFSGEYFCRVSTFESETSASSRMIVYAPARELVVSVGDLRPSRRFGFVNISCLTLGVFPEPSLRLYRQGLTKDKMVENTVFNSRKNREGTYDATVFGLVKFSPPKKPQNPQNPANPDFENSIGTPQESSEFICELSIPDTNYIIRKSAFYEPGSLALKHGMGSSISHKSTMPILTSSLVFLLFSHIFVIFTRFSGASL